MSKRDGRKRVLFVCVGNACRSLMAEAIARLDACDAIDAFSAGLMPIWFVPELTKQTLMKNGYGVEGLKSKGISSAIWERADVVINMSGRPKQEAFGEHSKVVDWEIEDPFERDPEDYQLVFDKIRARIGELAEEYKREYAANRLAEPRSRPRPQATSASLVAAKLVPRPGTWSEFAILVVLTVFSTFALRSLASHHDVQSVATADVQLGIATPKASARTAPPSPPTTAPFKSDSAPDKAETLPIVDPPPPEKADVARHDSSLASSFNAAALPAEKPSGGTLRKGARDSLRNRPELTQPKKQTARFTASANNRPLKKPKPEAAVSPLPVPPPIEANVPAPNLVPTRSADIRSDEHNNKANAETLVKRPVSAAQMTAEVSVLADPYPSLRADERGPKKQKQEASLELGHLLSQVTPVYPEEAKRQGVQGTVKLHAIVDRSGSVKTVQLSGPPILGNAAVNAVRQWQYTKTKLAGQAVETEVDVSVVFRLSTPKS